MSEAGDVGWAVRLLRDVDLVAGQDVEARRLAIVLTYFDSVRNDERKAGTNGKRKAR
jgi:hypothetical protein